MPTTGRLLGDWGENQAGNFLLRHGFKIVDRNYRAGTFGEIDIVAVKDGDFYFIEVKTRTKPYLAKDTAITREKKHKWQKALKSYCLQRSVPDTGIIMAGLFLLLSKPQKTLSFRFVVFAW